MKTLLVIALLWLHAFAAPALAQRKEATPLTDALKGWQTIRIAFILDGGDHYKPYPYFLLQRLNSEHVVLSSSDEDPTSTILPVVRAILTNEETQKIIERATRFYGQAQNQIGEKVRWSALPEPERTKAYSGHGYGIPAFYIRVEVFSHGRSYRYEDDFDDSSTINDFIHFVEDPKAATKQSP